METIEVGGREFGYWLEPDNYAGAPWRAQYWDGEITIWARRGKRPGEIAIAHGRTCRNYGACYFDFAGAVKSLRRAGVPGPDAAACAFAQADRLRQWLNGDWCYCDLVVALLDDEGDPTNHRSYLGRVESDSDLKFLAWEAETSAHELLRELELEEA